MIATTLAATTVIVIQPPMMADENRPRFYWGGGIGVPEGVHASVWAKRGSLGIQLNAGMASPQTAALSASGRWFLPQPLDTFFVAAGAMWPLGAHWNQSLAYFDVGWQWRQPAWFLEVAAGPAPFAWGNKPPNTLPALYTDWPRLRLSLGKNF